MKKKLLKVNIALCAVLIAFCISLAGNVSPGNDLVEPHCDELYKTDMQ